MDRHLDDVNDVSFVREALKSLEGFSDDSVDYVVAVGPTWWGGGVGGADLADVDMVVELVKQSMRVTRKEKGNFVAFGYGFSRSDAEQILGLVGVGGEIEEWIYEWGESPTLANGDGSEAMVRIVKK